MELGILSSFPAHASGNVGDRLLLESTTDLIEEVHGPTTCHVHWRGEDFTSRLEYLNDLDAIVLSGFEYLKFESGQYQIAQDIEAVDPPIIPLGAMHRFFPGDERELTRQQIGASTRSFLERVARYCPHGEIPVRTEWVGRILRRNGFSSTLTGDPAWFDPEYIHEPFHAPDTVDQLVFTTPHWSMYIDQAKELLEQLTRVFPDSDRTVVLHAAPTEVDREICDFAKTVDWDVHYASHEVNFIEFYRESDLHVGYRKHGHLAHLRWRRPSIVLAEDSRAQGLNEVLGTAGFPAFEPREGLSRKLGTIYDTFPMVGMYFVLDQYGLENLVPDRRKLVAPPRATAIEDVLRFISEQQACGWTAFDRVQETIDQTYEEGMKPFVESAFGH